MNKEDEIVIRKKKNEDSNTNKKGEDKNISLRKRLKEDDGENNKEKKEEKGNKEEKIEKPEENNIFSFSVKKNPDDNKNFFGKIFSFNLFNGKKNETDTKNKEIFSNPFANLKNKNQSNNIFSIFNSGNNNNSNDEKNKKTNNVDNNTSLSKSPFSSILVDDTKKGNSFFSSLLITKNNNNNSSNDNKDPQSNQFSLFSSILENNNNNKNNENENNNEEEENEEEDKPKTNYVGEPLKAQDYSDYEKIFNKFISNFYLYSKETRKYVSKGSGFFSIEKTKVKEKDKENIKKAVIVFRNHGGNKLVEGFIDTKFSQLTKKKDIRTFINIGFIMMNNDEPELGSARIQLKNDEEEDMIEKAFKEAIDFISIKEGDKK